jgi:hypothetical protein
MFRAGLVFGVATMAITVASAGAANAASCLTKACLEDSPGDFLEMLHDTSMQTSSPILLVAKPSGDHVTLTTDAGSSLSTNGNGMGFATVNGPFDELTITPDSPLKGFTAIGFKLDPVNKFDGHNLSDYSFTVDVNFVGGGSTTLTQTAALFPANDKFGIIAGTNEVISSIQISSLSGQYKSGRTFVPVDNLNFSDIKQISYDGVSGVPEPASWSMMIIGFGALGGILRRKRVAIA